MTLGDNWFSEICKEGGSAFSLKTAEKVFDQQTTYQHIEVYATEKYGNLMVIDGFVMLSTRDNFFYHEMMSHPVLFTHPDPGNVVIIGGGDCGTLREVLKHPGVKHCLQVEIDEQVTRAAEIHFPELCESNHDARAEFYFGDGIQWMKDAKPGSVDVIIVDSTDPIGPAEGLFNESFYRDCFSALGEYGALVQQSESPFYHMSIIKDMYRSMWNAGFPELVTLPFPQPVYPSGWWSATMAYKGSEAAAFREHDVREKTFPTVYYNADIHRAALAQPEFFKEAIAALRKG